MDSYTFTTGRTYTASKFIERINDICNIPWDIRNVRDWPQRREPISLEKIDQLAALVREPEDLAMLADHQKEIGLYFHNAIRFILSENSNPAPGKEQMLADKGGEMMDAIMGDVTPKLAHQIPLESGIDPNKETAPDILRMAIPIDKSRIPPKVIRPSVTQKPAPADQEQVFNLAEFRARKAKPRGDGGPKRD